MSHSKFYSSIVLLIFLNVIVKPLWIFGIDRQVQNITGVAEYGTYFSLLNLSIIFGFLLDWGLTYYVNRELAANKKELQEQLSTILFLKIIFALIYTGIIMLVAFFTGVKRWDIVWGVIIIQFLTYLFVFFRNVVTANQWFKTDAWLSVLDKMMMIIFCGLFIFGPDIFGVMNIHRFMIAQISCTATAVLVAFIILMGRGIKLRKPELKFIDKNLLFSVLPFAFTVFLMSAHLRTDGFLLERLHPEGAHETGIYAAAYRLLDASNMAGYLIASFLMPFAARLWSEKKDLQEIILQSRHLLIMFSIGMISVTCMLAPWLQEILYHRTDEYGTNILQWTIAALFGYSLVQIYGTVMTATGKITQFCWMNLGALIINISLNLFLIPLYGAFGCTIAAFISQTLLGLTTLIYVHSKIHKGIEWKSALVYVLSFGILCGLVYVLHDWGVSNWITLFLVILVTFAIMWGSKLVSVNTWLSFLKKQ